MIECSFLIPLRRDSEISDGASHPRRAWQWLEAELFDLATGFTIAPGEFRGKWKSTLSQSIVSDKSKKYEVAIPSKMVLRLRAVLRQA
jgi:hypothetical protein